MYKLKYYTLNKEERKNLKKEFTESSYGKSLNKRLIRIFILGIIGLGFSIYLFFTYSSIWDLITITSLLIASLIFILSASMIKVNKLNDFLIKKQKTTKKAK